jgi:arylsulfatase A-like enzyme
MTDDHSKRALGCYGNTLLRTPNLDRLAAEGVRFTNAFVTNSLCAPARASVLTGCYSHINGVRGNSELANAVEHLNAALPTFPQLLQNAGYHTGITGKWHLSDNPTGFDYWCVLPGQGLYFNPDFIDNGTRRKFAGYATDITTDLALDFLRQTPRNQPFCLLYQHKAPHRPFQPAPRHAHLFDSVELPYPETFDDDYATRRMAKEAEDMRFDISLAPDYKDLPAGLSPADRKKWIYQRFVRDYYAAVAGIDENLGRVLDHLDKNDLTRDTIVIYTTDNGFFLGEHGWYDKRFMYEPSLRVPLLIRYPGLAAAGRVENHLTVNIDYASTILDLAGIPIPSGMQGRTLRPLLNGGPPTDWRRSIYYTYYENSWAEMQKGGARSDPSFQYLTPHRVVPHRGVRTERHKLIEYYGEGDYCELFDLQADPHELRNLYGDPAHAQVTAQLRRELTGLRAQYQDS